jgi:hypothetical protein
METDPTLEFEFFLAQKLSMTVARLREEMPAQEFVRWSVYYGREAQRKQLATARAGG